MNSTEFWQHLSGPVDSFLLIHRVFFSHGQSCGLFNLKVNKGTFRQTAGFKELEHSYFTIIV